MDFQARVGAEEFVPGLIALAYYPGVRRAVQASVSQHANHVGDLGRHTIVGAQHVEREAELRGLDPCKERCSLLRRILVLPFGQGDRRWLLIVTCQQQHCDFITVHG
jgi:hypothetical protein